MALSAALAGVGAAPAYASSHGKAAVAHGAASHGSGSHGATKAHVEVSHGAAQVSGASRGGDAHGPVPSSVPVPDATLDASVVPASNPASSQQVPAPGEARASAGPVHTVSLPAALPSPAPSAAPTPAAIENEPMILSSGGWQGISLQAAVDLRIPMLFGAAVLLFVLLQALVDRRDPKVARAPERGDDDTVGFA